MLHCFLFGPRPHVSSGRTCCGRGAVRVLGLGARVPRGLGGLSGLPLRLQAGAHIWTDILPAHSCPLSSGKQEGLLLLSFHPFVLWSLIVLDFPLEQEIT